MPYSRPETVQELIDLLKLFPGDYPIEFQGLTLYQVKDRGVASFEFNEEFEIAYNPADVYEELKKRSQTKTTPADRPLPKIPE